MADKMVHLFLSEPSWSWDGDDESVKERISLLNELETVLWSVIASGSRSEARLWLCKTLSQITSLAPRNQRDLFVDLLKSRPRKQGLADQLWQMIFEKQPQKAGSILAKKCYMLENFFRGNPKRILAWFSNFAGNRGLEHRNGAKALSQFAFVNRDICWEELEWKGKHGQSPAMVATKPHYFLDLDVEQTVENFLENVPEFWSSNEFADSLKDGKILFVESEFFVNMFIRLMYKEDMREIWELIDEFFMEESFEYLCHHLLILFDEEELYVFLELLRKFLNPTIDPRNFSDPSYCIEIILSKCSGSTSMVELLLLNAIVSHGRQLLRILQDNEHQVQKLKAKDIVLQICSSSTLANDMIPLMKECVKDKAIKPIKWLSLHSWALHYFLSEGYCTPESWESLFMSNGISFRQSGKHALLHHNGFSDQSGSDLEERVTVRSRRSKKEKHRKKRRRNIRHDDTFDDELLDLDSSYGSIDFHSKAGSWLLSTDGFSTSWSSVDLPEHISKYCFSTWMKWVFAKWD